MNIHVQNVTDMPKFQINSVVYYKAKSLEKHNLPSHIQHTLAVFRNVLACSTSHIFSPIL